MSKRSDDIFERVIIIAAAAIALMIFTGTVKAEPTVEPFVSYTHISDILRGCPFACRIEEGTLDQIAVGATITAGKNRAWEIDLSQGVRTPNCALGRGCSWESSTEFEVRFYPGRRKGRRPFEFTRLERE